MSRLSGETAVDGLELSREQRMCLRRKRAKQFKETAEYPLTHAKSADIGPDRVNGVSEKAGNT